MLSFEEFFIKKKIDLFALKSANRDLYDEFEQHYSAMGEKSFDHTKKFWFNKLRKSYLLAEAPIATVGAPEKVSEHSTEDKVATTNPKLGFKPKFATKAVSSTTESTEPAQKITEKEAVATKPAGFKPRFKAGSTKTVEPANATPTTIEPTEDKTTEKEVAATKPAGFKPRFKAGLTKTNPPTGENNTK